MKKCTACFVDKPEDEFGKNRARCRACISIYNRQYTKARWENDAEYRSKRCAYAIKWVEQNPEKRAVIAKKRNAKAWKNNREAVIARACIGQQVRRGNRPPASSMKCRCGDDAKHYHHPLGYSPEYRYIVDPICTKCHAKAHKRAA